MRHSGIIVGSVLAGILVVSLLAGCSGGTSGPGLMAVEPSGRPLGGPLALVGPSGDAAGISVTTEVMAEKKPGQFQIRLVAAGPSDVAGFSAQVEVGDGSLRCVAAQAAVDTGQMSIACGDVSEDGLKAAVAGASLAAPLSELATFTFSGSSEQARLRWTVRLYDTQGELLARTESAPSKAVAASGLLGDLDGDGLPTVGDAIKILRIAVGLDPYDSCGDVNNSSSIDVGDAIKVLRCAVGLDPWPIGECGGQDVTLELSVAVSGSGLGAAEGSAIDVMVEVTSPGDTMEVPTSATVTHVLPDSSTEDLTPNLVRDPGGRLVTLTSFTATQLGIHRVQVTGPAGGLILHDWNEPSSSLTLGLTEVAFEVLAGRTVYGSPAVVTLPTLGTTLNRSATFNGLQPGDVVETQLRTNTGVKITKTGTVAPGHTSVTIEDVAGGVAATAINGVNSWLKCLARQGP